MTMTDTAPLDAMTSLERRFARIAALGDALGILHWDNETMMPEGGSATRGEALATLSVLRHEMITDPKVAELVEEAEAGGDALDPWRRANLREIRRIHLMQTALPPDLVEATSKAVTRTELRWRNARRDNDFEGLRPDLEEVLRLKREAGTAMGEALGLPVYDALLAEYEPGGSSAAIDDLFDDLAGFLPGFTEAVMAAQSARPQPKRPTGPFPIESQRALALRLMEAVGFDFTRGRLDVSTHPFCGGATDDVRITTRYDEEDFTRSLMGVLHETGHALYEQGRPRDWLRQPVGEARGMSMHESQSLLIEMQACRSAEFLTFAAPLIRQTFEIDGAAAEPDNLHSLYTRVEPGFIRVDADEVTYPAHVILRYRLERAMLEGDLALADLPGAWADGMKALLGIVPPDDRQGCLQDIHWPGGAWGYFPTYTLGAMTAAQLFQAAVRDRPEIPGAIARGDFAPLRSWLAEHVHARGSLYGTDELLALATGRPLDPESFKRHLRRRYLGSA